ncbi:MAG: AsmA-like C-terminal region-containing protein, partial [Maricaulaceae bacterium]
DQPRALEFAAADAGEAVAIIFGVNMVRGGSLSAEGTLPPLAGPKEAPTELRVRARNLTLVGAPPLAQILSIASLEGLGNTLAGEGIRFGSLDAPLELSEGRITLDEARASGQALGVTVNGVIDLEARAFDLDGVLVPAYGMNSVLGVIPVLGDIFVSRRGEGVFAMTYTLEGPFANTQVSVNLLSALAPGFLRRIFEPIEPEVGEAASDAQASPGR